MRKDDRSHACQRTCQWKHRRRRRSISFLIEFALGIFVALLAIGFKSHCPCSSALTIKTPSTAFSGAVAHRHLGDIKDGFLFEPKERKAYPQQTPHSGRHFFPSHPAYTENRRRNWRHRLFQKRRQRFMEGWYYRLTLPEDNVSFAFIISIEDPGRRPPSDLRLACIQVVGPNDEYIVQGDRDDTLFWAWNRMQGLGCTFSYRENVENLDSFKRHAALTRDLWLQVVDSGFQILPNSLLGKVRGVDGTKYNILDDPDEIFECDFDFSVTPICGWGGSEESQQKSLAGWLSKFPVFEPHWQVTLADARATGRVRWKEKVYEFQNAPMYSEKNWGAALPEKWYWTQCNAFRGYEQLSVVAGGGIRKIPLGKREALGMVSVHYNGVLYEAVPWLGGMSWEVSTWGSWKMWGNNTISERPFEVEVTYTCDPDETPGLVFRAPTPDQGMVRFCRDTFEAHCTLTLWELEWDDTRQAFVRRDGKPLIDRAVSSQGGAEVGGGPWWDVWKSESRVKPIVKALLRLPYKLQRAKRSILPETIR